MILKNMGWCLLTVVRTSAEILSHISSFRAKRALVRGRLPFIDVCSMLRGQRAWMTAGKCPVKAGPGRKGEGKEKGKLHLRGIPMGREGSCMFLWSTGGKQSTYSPGHGVRGDAAAPCGLKHHLRGCSWPRNPSPMLIKTGVPATKPTENARDLYPCVVASMFHIERNN